MTVTELLFNGANLFVLPFWVVMILLPNWGITRWIMNSWLPFIGLVGVYLYLLVGTLTPEVAQSLTNPNLETIARLFSTERAAAAGWIHFLVFDLFVGRWIYPCFVITWASLWFLFAIELVHFSKKPPCRRSLTVGEA